MFLEKNNYFLENLNILDEEKKNSQRGLTKEKTSSSAILKETVTSDYGRNVNISQGYNTKHQPNPP